MNDENTGWGRYIVEDKENVNEKKARRAMS